MTQGTGTVAKANIGRYQLAYRWRAAGQPTVVLEAGAGCSQDSWTTVFDLVAQFTSVLSYDRANVGMSDTAVRKRTCHNIVTDLHELLRVVQIPGPYVLVGHSFGGHIVRLYAHLYPGDVAGVVLVDSMHHDQDARALALMPLKTPNESASVTTLRDNLIRGYIDDSTCDPEGAHIALSNEQVRAVGSLGAIPLAVLTACQRGEPPKDLPTDYMQAYEQMFYELQQDLVGLSTRSIHLLAEHSGHFIHSDEPELVVRAIQQVIALGQISAA